MADMITPRFYKGESKFEIQVLILDSQDFIVFIDRDCDVDWETTDNYDQTWEGEPKKHGSILNEAALIEAWPSDFLEPNVKLKFKRLIGEAVARNLECDYLNAEKMLAHAKDFIQSRSDESARVWYVTSAAKLAMMAPCLAGLLWIFRGPLQSYLGTAPFFILIGALAGGIGAFLSVAQRLGRLTLNSSAGEKLHRLEGRLRIVVGVISGFAASSAVFAQIILPVFSSAGKQNLAIVLSGFLAGASERLVHTLIAATEKQAGADGG